MPVIKYQDRDVDVDELDVLTDTERWNEYQLADGSVLSVKFVLVRVFRAKNEKSPDGAPLYITHSQNVVKVKTT